MLTHHQARAAAARAASSCARWTWAGFRVSLAIVKERVIRRGMTPGKATGLGLVMVKRLAQMRGGAVALENIPGQGGVFHAWLPCVGG